MRKRDHRVEIYFNDDELARLTERVRKSGLSRSPTARQRGTAQTARTGERPKENSDSSRSRADSGRDHTKDPLIWKDSVKAENDPASGKAGGGT